MRDDGEAGCETVLSFGRSPSPFYGRWASGENGRKLAASTRVGPEGPPNGLSGFNSALNTAQPADAYRLLTPGSPHPHPSPYPPPEDRKNNGKGLALHNFARCFQDQPTWMPLPATR